MVTTFDKVLDSSAQNVEYSLSQYNIDFMLIQYVPVTEVQLDKTSLTMEAGGNDIIAAEVLPYHANIQGVEWSSSNPSVATVSEEGLATGIHPGTAVITVTSVDGRETATCSIVVTESISSITLNKSELTLVEGYNETLYASITPLDFQSNIEWSSNDEWIAEVSSDGVVTATSPGNVTITARLVNGYKTATCVVQVKPSTIYGVITGSAVSEGSHGYEVEMLADGMEVSYQSSNMVDVDTRNLYQVSIG